MDAPSLSTWVAQTFLPVSALTAKTQPLVDAMNRQPSAMTGVPVKSPSPPAWLADTENDLVRGAACTGPIVFPAGWERVLDRSWPYIRHSPPACFLGAHCPAAALE